MRISLTIFGRGIRQIAYIRQQSAQICPDHVPDNLMIDQVISVYQDIAKTDDSSAVLHSLSPWEIAFLQPVAHFADNLEFSLTARPEKRIGRIMSEIMWHRRYYIAPAVWFCHSGTATLRLPQQKPQADRPGAVKP
jgi:hypothetical protein